MASPGDVLGMQQLGNVTSADLIVLASIEEVAPGGQRIMEFADGEGVTPESTERAVTRMGIDGKFVYGIVMRSENVTLTMLPTSEFLKLVDECVAISRKRRKGLKWTLEVTYPAIGKVTTYREGILVNNPALPAAQDTLGNVEIALQFGDFDTQDIGIN